MKLPEKLYTLRKSRHISQEELAARMNVSRQAVSKWESGQAAPDSGNLLLLSDILHVSIDYLLHDDWDADTTAPPAPPTPLSAAIPPETPPAFPPKRKRRISSAFLIGAEVCAIGCIGAFVCAMTILLQSSTATQDAETGTVSFHLNGYFTAAALFAALLAVGFILLLLLYRHFRK